MLSREEDEMLVRTGPGTPMGTLLRRFWLPALLSEELPKPDCDPVRVRLMSEDLVAFRDTEGKLGLLRAYCPHRRAHLFFGRNEECGIRCIYHGWKFDVDGNCVDLPTEPPESNFKDKVKAVSYKLREAGGVIWAYMGPQDQIPDLPHLPLTQVPADHRFVIKRWQESNYFQALEGGIDSAHTRYLHGRLDAYHNRANYQRATESLRKRYQENPDNLSPRELDILFRMADKMPRVMAQRTNYGLAIGARGTVSEENYYWRINQFLMPFYTMPPRDPGGHAFVPIDDENCWVWTFRVTINRPLTNDEIYAMRTGQTDSRFGAPVDKNYFPLHNKANDFRLDRELQRTFNFTGIYGTGNQDMAAQVSMGPITDRTDEMLGVTDVGIIEMRKLLLTAAKDLCEGKEPAEALNPEFYDGVRGVSLIRDKQVSFEECVGDALGEIERTKQRFRELNSLE
ncbi:MAG: Rieske 2Fe-2S domain-containing protein [Deltaproteobacteria bacterium]|nr:Rieske 2Fe-2S domain-containing protein [Deltaproteobacteria bacterium]